MLVYIIPFLLTFYGSVKYEIFSSKGNGKVLWICLFIYLTFLIGLRHMVGGDTYFYAGYYQFYLENRNSFLEYKPDDDYGYQPLFIQLMLFVKLFSDKFVGFQLVHILIINGVLFWFISKESKYRFTVLFFCLLTFYINYTVEILRESLAIMVFLLNYKNLENNKWVRYYLGAFIAVQFHMSAIFLFVLPFFKFLKLNLTYCIVVVGFLLILTQLQIILAPLEAIQKIEAKISFYSKTTSSINTTLLFLAAKFLIPISFFTYVKNGLNRKVKYEWIICLLGLVGIGTAFNTLIFMRFTNYLLVFLCIAMSEYIVPYLKPGRVSMPQFVMIITVAFTIVVTGYLSFLWPTGYYIKWVPYMSVFSPEGQRNEFIYRE